MKYTRMKFEKLASGDFDGNCWKWDPVIWKRCPRGIYYSNRYIPDKFWDKKWESKNTSKNSAGILIWKSNNMGEKSFLLIQSYSNFYGIPKGKINIVETFFDGAMREFYEETGTKLDISVNDCFEIRKIIGNKRTSIYTLQVDNDYEITTKPISDIEISSFGFIKESDLKYFKLNKLTKDIISNII